MANNVALPNHETRKIYHVNCPTLLEEETRKN